MLLSQDLIVLLTSLGQLQLMRVNSDTFGFEVLLTVDLLNFLHNNILLLEKPSLSELSVFENTTGNTKSLTLVTVFDKEWICFFEMDGDEPYLGAKALHKYNNAEKSLEVLSHSLEKNYLYLVDREVHLPSHSLPPKTSLVKMTISREEFTRVWKIELPSHNRFHNILVPQESEELSFLLLVLSNSILIVKKINGTIIQSHSVHPSLFRLGKEPTLGKQAFSSDFSLFQDSLFLELPRANGSMHLCFLKYFHKPLLIETSPSILSGSHELHLGVVNCESLNPCSLSLLSSNFILLGSNTHNHKLLQIGGAPDELEPPVLKKKRLEKLKLTSLHSVDELHHFKHFTHLTRLAAKGEGGKTEFEEWVCSSGHWKNTVQKIYFLRERVPHFITAEIPFKEVDSLALVDSFLFLLFQDESAVLRYTEEGLDEIDSSFNKQGKTLLVSGYNGKVIQVQPHSVTLLSSQLSETLKSIEFEESEQVSKAVAVEDVVGLITASGTLTVVEFESLKEIAKLENVCDFSLVVFEGKKLLGIAQCEEFQIYKVDIYLTKIFSSKDLRLGFQRAKNAMNLSQKKGECDEESKEETRILPEFEKLNIQTNSSLDVKLERTELIVMSDALYLGVLNTLHQFYLYKVLSFQ